LKKIIFIFPSLFLLAVVFSHSDPLWEDGLQPFDAKRFIAPDVCGVCHENIFDMWDGTLHAGAFDDSLYRAATKLFVTLAHNTGERDDAEHCVSCHNPIAYRSGQISGSSEDFSKTDEVTRHAISCDLCHTISEIVKTMNALFNTDPGFGEDTPGRKRGPHDDAESDYHETYFSSLHTSSEICGTCHNVTHRWYYTKLEGTYDEWLHSPYHSLDSTKVVTCQDCHMRQSEGRPSTGMTIRPDYPGTSASMGKERPHIYRHNVVGGNTFVPVLLGHPERAVLARDRLQHTAVLEVFTGEEHRGQVSRVTIRVKNEGAGHMIPTGVTEFRQMWLEVTVKDRKGKIIFTSGGVGLDGKLFQDTRVFQTLFGDSEGHPTINVSRAVMILNDKRIPPKGWQDEIYFMEKSFKKPLSITAELKYRSMDPAIVKLLMGGQTYDIPIVTMAKIETVIK
jgi:hypothetical protein